jgi:hypothetical protein
MSTAGEEALAELFPKTDDGPKIGPIYDAEVTECVVSHEGGVWTVQSMRVRRYGATQDV